MKTYLEEKNKMKKLIIFLSSLFISVAASANQHAGIDEMFRSDSDTYHDIFLIEQKQKPFSEFGMRAFTGMEYEKINYSKHAQEEYISTILLDGHVNFGQGWAMIYEAKTIAEYEDGEKVDDTRTILELKPSYVKWISPNFAYGFKFGTEINRGEEESRDKFFIEPNISMRKGKNFLYIPIIQGVKGRDGSIFYESEILYLYNLTERVNIGTKLFYKNEKDSFSFKEKAIRPLIQYTFENRAFVELKVEIGETEIHDRSRYEYVNYGIFTEIPITNQFSFTGEASYRDWVQKNANQYSWGDKEGVFFKAGVTWSF